MDLILLYVLKGLIVLMCFCYLCYFIADCN